MKNPKGAAIEVASIRELAKAPWWDEPSPEELAAITSASLELARRAYIENDASAVERAEQVLYALNLDSRFAVPPTPRLASVWTTLMQGKLAHHRRELGQLEGGAGSLDEMATSLEAIVEKWGAYRHPLLEDLESGADLDEYRVWAQNWFGSCFGFSLQLASLVQRTSGSVKQAVLENLNDEFEEGATHDNLRVRFYERLSLRHNPTEAVYQPAWVNESTALLNLRTGLSNLSNPLWALGAFYTIEANWPHECKRHHAINKARGFDDETLEYWTTHAFADEHHADEWLTAVKSMCATEDDRVAVLEGAIIQLRLRWKMYDAIKARIAGA